jgi:hypothetical protein
MLGRNRMPLLVAISILSFCALFWIALAAARNLRARRHHSPHSAAHGQMHEIFEGGEFRTPRSLRLLQHLSQHVAQQPRTALPQPPAAATPRKAPKSVGHADRTIYNKDLGASQSARTVPATGRKVL